MRRIVAIGGGGFLMEGSPCPIDDFLLALANKPAPRICFIPTASGDSEEHLEKFYATFSQKPCIPTHLAFFRKARPHALPLPDYAEHLLTQDLIFVGGGNTRSALAVWREWRLDAVLEQAWSSGVILSGMSAGALCWFEVGVSDSFGDGAYHPLRALGFLRGACATHYDALPERRAMLHDAVSARTVPETIAIDEGAAVVFREGIVERVVSWRNGSTAYRVWLNDAAVSEVPFACEALTPVQADLTSCGRAEVRRST